MRVSFRHIAVALFMFVLAPSAALADCLGCNRRPPSGCQSSCNQPPPPPPTCAHCQAPQIVVPRPYVPAPSLVTAGAGASASARASATAIAIASAQTGDVIVRSNMIGDMGISVGVDSQALGFGDIAVTAETAAIDRNLNISAICMDAQGNPHPASQTFGERDVAENYQGEIFRCISGTRMRVTSGERTFNCATGEALWYENGQTTCRTQIVRRPCNERSLLRRYGPGEKVVRVRETASAQTASTGAVSGVTQFGGGMQGGVGY